MCDLFNLENLGPWAQLPFFEQSLPEITQELLRRGEFLPPPQLVFAALERTQPNDVKVVILGQDPYPRVGHAHGFAFSAAPDVIPLPRSLRNIYTEMARDIGQRPASADLRNWADQGVLLLNTILTVPPGEALGHCDLGWQRLTREVLQLLQDRPRAYILWGDKAQSAAQIANNPQNFKIETSHPSPLSAHHSFWDSRPFSRINAWLQAQNLPAINWGDPEGP